MDKLVPEMILLYQGPARIHLQGENALLVARSEADNEMRYFIGSEQTNLVVRDFRQRTIMEAREAIRRQYQNGFARSFNQTAQIEINYDYASENMEILLLDNASSEERCPVLWIGVLDNQRLPRFETEWELFKPLPQDKVAFCALLSTTH